MIRPSLFMQAADAFNTHSPAHCLSHNAGEVTDNSTKERLRLHLWVYGVPKHVQVGRYVGGQCIQGILVRSKYFLRVLGVNICNYNIECERVTGYAPVPVPAPVPAPVCWCRPVPAARTAIQGFSGALYPPSVHASWC